MRKYILFVLFTLMFSSNLYSQNGWVRYYTGYNIPLNDIYFINNSTGWCVGDKYILKSTNGGINWTRQADTNNVSQYINYLKVFFINDNTGWVAGGGSTPFPFCMDDRIILKTTNSGQSWYSIPAPSANDNIPIDITAVDENNVFVCDNGVETFCIGSSGAIFRSGDGGSSWGNVTQLDNTYGFRSITFINPQTGWALGSKTSDTPPTITNVFKTTNSGFNWSILSSDTIQDFGLGRKIQFLNSNTGYVKRVDKNLKSTDGGVTWFEFTTSPDSIYKFQFINPNIGSAIGGPSSNYMRRTTDGGTTWQNQLSNGSTFHTLASIHFISELKGWTGSNNGYVYITGTGGVTSINTISSEVPDKFILLQNYPNPFNPNTSIKFEIPRQGFVSLKVFDISGREVAELVKKEMQPGVYEYNFDGTGLVSGVYFYRIAVHTDKLQSGDFTETRRMVLVK